MNLLSRCLALAVLLSAFSGCSAIKDVKGSAIESSLGATSGKKAEGGNIAPTRKYSATLRISQYLDQRQVANPRYLGQLTSRILGVNGNELFMDQDIAVLATKAIKTRFDSEGFQILEGGDAGSAVFEVSGIIKELTLNVRNRDDINISIETTVKDAASGRVVWSGLVTEKNDRFAGVSGNSKKDVDAYLNKGLRIVSGKTVEAINSSLVASRPELFNLTPGTKTIKGVDVYVAPPAASPATPPVIVAAVPPETSPVNTTGRLTVSTNPSRAKVYLNGVYFGLSPLRSEIELGVHEIVVQLAGYRSATERVSVRKGENTELELSLER
jgi:hypothetical protein